MTKEYAKQRLKELKKEEANLLEIIKYNRDWPNTLDGMLEVSEYWGFFTKLEGEENRYFLHSGTGDIKPCIINPYVVFTSMVEETIRGRGMGIYEAFGFKSFESTKALLVWMSEVE